MTFTLGESGHLAEHNRLIAAIPESVRSVLTFGAVGDGTTDDTSAIADGVAWAVANGTTLLFPNATYKLVGDVEIGLGSGWSLIGDHATLVQSSDNVGHFRFIKEGTHRFEISGFDFSWTNLQDAADTAAVAIAFDMDAHTGAGVYNFRMDRLKFDRGYGGVGILQDPTIINPVWGCHLTWFFGGATMKGPIISLDQITAGQPHIHVGHFYARRDQGVTAAIIVRNASVTMDGVEINLFTDEQISVRNSRSVDLRNVRGESGSLTGDDVAFMDLADSSGVISALQFQTVEFDAGLGNSAYFVSVATGGYPFVVNGMSVIDTTITSGSAFAFRPETSVIDLNAFLNTETALTGTGI